MVGGAEQQLCAGAARIEAGSGLERLDGAARPVGLETGIPQRHQDRRRLRPHGERLPVFANGGRVLALPEQVVPARHRVGVTGDRFPWPGCGGRAACQPG